MLGAKVAVFPPDMQTVGREVTRNYSAVLTCSTSDPTYSRLNSY